MEPRGCIRNVFTKVEFRCLLAVMIGKFEFPQGGKREVVVKAGGTVKSQRGIPVSVREVVWVWILSVTKRWGKVGRLEGMHGIMCSHSMPSAL